MKRARPRKPRTPVNRLRVLALLMIPMTRHQIAAIMGYSYESAVKAVAALTSARQVEVCGWEAGPDGKRLRQKVRAIEQRQPA